MKVWTADLESTSLPARYRRIATRVAEAATKASRSAESIRLVAVTKTVSVARMREAYGLGIREFGESRVQEALQKRSQLSDLAPRWHFIGHLQTNKVKRVVGDFLLIHSVDSWRLAEALNEEAVSQGLVQEILLQVNVSGVPEKYGIIPDEAPAMAARVVSGLPGVQLRGFMAMAPRTEDPEATRPYFRRLREIRDGIASELGPRASLDHLSMGMSHDYAVAVEEGATLIRVGSELFGDRPAQEPVEPE